MCLRPGQPCSDICSCRPDRLRATLCQAAHGVLHRTVPCAQCLHSPLLQAQHAAQETQHRPHIRQCGRGAFSLAGKADEQRGQAGKRVWPEQCST